MTMARIQPFCRKNNNNLGYFVRIKINTKLVTDRNKTLCLYNNPFFYHGSQSGTFQFEEDIFRKDARGISEIYMK